MAMRVLQLGPYPPPHGGVQYNLVAIRQFLESKRIQSEVINLTRFRKTDKDGVYYPKTWLHALWLLLRLHYDIVHLHIGGKVNVRILGLCLACCMISRSKAVLTFHSGGYPGSKEGKSARLLSLRGFVFRRFDLIIAVNQEIVELFRKFGVRDDRIRLIYPHASIDLADNVRLIEPLKSFYDRFDPILVTVGLLEPEYDLDLQTDVLGLILEQYPNAGLAIIGSGSLEGRLRANINSKLYSEHILLCGDVPHEVTLHAINESDIFLRTTLYDGDSIALREALQLGVPVIATDTGMRPDGAFLVQKSDMRGLYNSIIEKLMHGAKSGVMIKQDDENIKAVFDAYLELTGENG